VTLGLTFWPMRPSPLRNEGFEDACVASARVAEVATAATAAGPAGIKAIGCAIGGTEAAVFPIAGTRAAIFATALAAAAAVAAATAAVATTATATATAVAAAAAAIAAATTAVSTTAWAAAAATTTAAAGLGLVDAKGTAHQFSALKALNGPSFHGVIGHFHKGKASLAPGVPFQGEGAIHDVAVTREKFNHVLLLSAEGEVAYKDAHERGWGNRYGCQKTRGFLTSVD
jgi:hypothetical protein